MSTTTTTEAQRSQLATALFEQLIFIVRQEFLFDIFSREHNQTVSLVMFHNWIKLFNEFIVEHTDTITKRISLYEQFLQILRAGQTKTVQNYFVAVEQNLRRLRKAQVLESTADYALHLAVAAAELRRMEFHRDNSGNHSAQYINTVHSLFELTLPDMHSFYRNDITYLCPPSFGQKLDKATQERVITATQFIDGFLNNRAQAVYYESTIKTAQSILRSYYGKNVQSIKHLDEALLKYYLALSAYCYQLKDTATRADSLQAAANQICWALSLSSHYEALEKPEPLTERIKFLKLYGLILFAQDKEDEARATWHKLLELFAVLKEMAAGNPDIALPTDDVKEVEAYFQQHKDN